MKLAAYLLALTTIATLGATAFGACRDFSGHYKGRSMNDNGRLELEIVQTACSEMEITLKVLDYDIVDRRVVKLDGNHYQIGKGVDVVSASYEIHNNELNFSERHERWPSWKTYYEVSGKYYFTDSDTLIEESVVAIPGSTSTAKNFFIRM